MDSANVRVVRVETSGKLGVGVGRASRTPGVGQGDTGLEKLMSWRQRVLLVQLDAAPRRDCGLRHRGDASRTVEGRAGVAEVPSRVHVVVNSTQGNVPRFFWRSREKVVDPEVCAGAKAIVVTDHPDAAESSSPSVEAGRGGASCAELALLASRQSDLEKLVAEEKFGPHGADPAGRLTIPTA